MRSNTVLRACTILVATALLAGCAASIAPSGWLPSAERTQWDGYGSWAIVTLSIGPGESCEGELIAATSDSIFILQGSVLEAYGVNQVGRIHLQTYDSRHGGLTAWTAFGALSTISHGFILALSAPVWIITGSVATSAQSRLPHRTIADGSWSQLAPYCRYPGGIPASVNRSKIAPKQIGIVVRSTGT